MLLSSCQTLVVRDQKLTLNVVASTSFLSKPRMKMIMIMIPMVAMKSQAKKSQALIPNQRERKMVKQFIMAMGPGPLP